MSPSVYPARTLKRDLRGQRFGRLLVLDDEPQSRELPGGRKVFWHVLCDCGADLWTQRGNLTNGHTVSCGCLKVERAKERLTTHGHSPRGAKSVEYMTWLNMYNRCHNPASSYYHCYGARGITVCERWRYAKDDPQRGFAAFFADMGARPSPKHSLGRKDNDGPYSPENCRWETAAQQASNTRANRWITCDGRTQTLAQWSRETGIPAPTLHRRLAEGWDPEIALRTDPLRYWDRRPKRRANH